MDLRDVRDLIKLLDESNLTKLEIEDPNGFKLKLEKNCSEAASKSVPVRGAESVLEDEQKLDNTISARDLDQALKTITSPMVGTFYRAPAPDEQPYISVGDVVMPGQTVCIIEAMKIMNEIQSEVQGKVVEILVDNAEPVEYGQPLFILETV